MQKLLGSPPHTWRIRFLATFKITRTRITSTHVENTRSASLSLISGKDHLHTRGEYEEKVIMRKTYKGSPPHTWRIPLIKLTQGTGYRITSTHVENTVNKSQYNNNHKTIDPKISSLCQLLLYLFLSH